MTTKAEQKIADSQREHVQKLSRPTFEETKATSFCSSCNRFLWGSDRHELPVKLPCGHVVGSACLVKLMAHEQSFDGCPTCRDVYLNSANFWYKKLLECDLRRPGEQKRLSKPEMWWALGADDMWQDFCKDMVRSLREVTDPREWLGKLPEVMRLLHISTVENFMRDGHHMHHPKDSDDIKDTQYPKSYRTLREHLDHPVCNRAEFLAAGEGTHMWLADCHRQIKQSYEDLVPGYRAAQEPNDAVRPGHPGEEAREDLDELGD